MPCLMLAIFENISPVIPRPSIPPFLSIPSLSSESPSIEGNRPPCHRLPSDVPKTIFPIPSTISLLSLSTIDLGTNSVAVGLIGGIVWRFPGGEKGGEGLDCRGEALEAHTNTMKSSSQKKMQYTRAKRTSCYAIGGHVDTLKPEDRCTTPWHQRGAVSLQSTHAFLSVRLGMDSRKAFKTSQHFPCHRTHVQHVQLWNTVLSLPQPSL
jgi:hypothetical protein